jgi:hypothetical protein
VAAQTGASASLPMLMTRNVLPQMAPQAAKAIQGLAAPAVAGPSVIDGRCRCRSAADRYGEGGQTLIPKPASPGPAIGEQEPDAWVGQSRSVVQMMTLLAP